MSDDLNTPPSPAVTVENLHKLYRETVAVAGLSFQVEAGSVMGLVGPNGAGKTTTMRCLAGIVTPTQGQLCVAGFDVANDPVEAKRQLAYVPDNPKLFDSLSVREHLEFVAAAYLVDDWEAKAAALLQEFDLQTQSRKLASELSRGMRQKAAICCAYLHNPQVVMFDEPLTGLDPRGIRNLKQSIHQRAAQGTAVIVSSHLLSLVEDLCSHLLILHQGRSLFAGPIGEVRAAFGELEGSISLEEIFFRATESLDDAAAPSGPRQSE